MEDLITQAEARHGIRRQEIAPRTVFVSHETYTPARGGRASAEIFALRHVFGEVADRIVIANTKGFTGHAMATGIEDVVAVKALETGCVPPVANFKEVDPELGSLNLSKGGMYPVEYALRLGAGFGSQISMTLVRWVHTQGEVHRAPGALGYAYRISDPGVWSSWLSRIAGYPTADLEVVRRTLRVRDQGPAAQLEKAAQEARAVSVSVPTVDKKLSPVPATPIKQPETSPAPAPIVTATEPKPKPAKSEPVRLFKPAPAGDDVKERVLTVVAAKTGYPVDMLDLDLDLEADLGVDTVKQAEVFAAIREAYAIPRDENLKLRDFPTLAHVIRFVHERRPDIAAEKPIPSTDKPSTSLAEVKQQVKATIPKPAAASAAEPDAVKERILALVVEKTGYPKDMLDLDLDLEADLGVDTVKQAEMFAAIREIYNIPRDENRKLRDYPTLAHVIRFVYEKRPDLAAVAMTAPARKESVQAAPAPPQPAPALAATALTAAAPASGADAVKERILALVVEKTGYPQEMLDLDLDLEADLGIDTVKQAEMFAAIREIYNIPRDENRKLRDYPTLAHVIRFVYERRPDLAAPAPSAENVRQAGPAPAPVAEMATDNAIKENILEIVAEKTGYPKEMLDLDLDLEADLGIDTVKQAEMFAAVRAAYNIPRDENLKLRDFPTLASVIKFARDRQPKTTSAAQERALKPNEEKLEEASVVTARPAL